MRFGWIASPAAHAVALAAAIIVWPRAIPDLNVDAAVVPIDVITFSDVSNITAVAPPAPDEEIEQPEETGAPQPSAALVEEGVEAIPDKIEAVKPPPKKTEKDKKAAQRVDLDQLALLIDRSKKNPGKKEIQSAPEAKPGEEPRKGFGAADGLTATEIDALRAQLRECWRAPVDAPNPERLIVRVRIKLNKSGDLSSEPELVQPRVMPMGDPPLRVAAENAIRAVRVCAPFELPPERYTRWREIIFTFDPREMVQ